MKKIGIQGIFTRKDLLELVEIMSEKGAEHALLCCGKNKRFEVIETKKLQKEIDDDISGLWLNTVPFVVESTPYPKIGADFPGSFSISFHDCIVEFGELAETVVGTLTPATGEQLKIWESGLRHWKKRIVRDVHMYSRVLNKVFPDEKLNVSRDAISGYEQGKWKLVAGFPGGAILVHPIAANKKIPFDMSLV